ncbi:Fur family transcriptional regulator [Spiroplasma sp. TIUS-1]|uniref:Fur family transcriptional regulator n=1 Tax=Spiroplasma sp. TIUS-1 TaxID=216963 RepID=UPI0013977339|nr:transcriptional repressor [Spiroplasma sp. TIUS-1]QHX36117.1 Fur family transcriptional regulator [Spiroplasma sp. TIUS-1]
MNSTEMNDFYINRLKELKIKLTELRINIIKIISRTKHFTINELIDMLKQMDSKVNIMSVYNNIDLLLENHLLYANTFNGKYIIYEAIKPHLIHIKCDECSKIIDVDDKKENTQFMNSFISLGKKFNVEVNHYKIELHGICNECK